MSYASFKGYHVPMPFTGPILGMLNLMEQAIELGKFINAGNEVLRPRIPSVAWHYDSGDIVRVRSAAEILSSLDMNGRLDGLPFLAAMVPMVGMTGHILKVLPKTSVIVEFSHDLKSVWSAEWLMPQGPAHQLAPRAEAAAYARLMALAAHHSIY